MYHVSCTELSRLTTVSFWRFYNSFDTILSSCEGVLWNADTEIKGSAATLNRLRELGKQIFFITNNSMRTREEIVQHGESIGFIMHKNEVISSSYLTADYLKNCNFSGVAYVVGSRGLVAELRAVGIKFIGTGPDIAEGNIPEIYENAYIDPNVKAVIVGLDEYFSLPKLIKASTYLQDPKCLFVAVSFEERRSGFSPKIVPAAGSILTAIETCSGRKAKILGKPSSLVGEYLMRNRCVDPQRTLLVGDRLRIDMLLGRLCGFQTLYVLSGMTEDEELHRRIISRSLNEIDPALLPDLYIRSLDDLLSYLTLKK